MNELQRLVNDIENKERIAKAAIEKLDAAMDVLEQYIKTHYEVEEHCIPFVGFVIKKAGEELNESDEKDASSFTAHWLKFAKRLLNAQQEGQCNG